MVNNFLASFFTSTTRAEIFRILFDGRDNERYLREIEKLTFLKINSIQKEIKHLEELDLITSRIDGNRIYYAANAEHPIYLELVSIVKKTIGVYRELEILFEDSRIKCSFVFGSFAGGKENSTSDLDIVIIGDIGLRETSKLLANYQKVLGREINPHVFKEVDWKKRVKNKDHFVTSILKSNIEVIKGDIEKYR